MTRVTFTVLAAMTLLLPGSALAVTGPVTVPEPSVTLLIIAGGLGAAGLARFRRRQK